MIEKLKRQVDAYIKRNKTNKTNWGLAVAGSTGLYDRMCEGKINLRTYHKIEAFLEADRAKRAAARKAKKRDA